MMLTRLRTCYNQRMEESRSFCIIEIQADAIDSSVTDCMTAVWGGTSRPDLAESTKAKFRRQPSILLIARDTTGQVVGFRFAHEMEHHGEKIMYDQDGGVRPEFRRRGIGRALLRQQHVIARSRGYRMIRTGVAVPLKPMIILNLEEGFEIVDLAWDEGFHVNVLWFMKRL